MDSSGKAVPGWYSWKPIAIKQALEMRPLVLWIDAGSTILKSLQPLFSYIEENGYFLWTIGEEVEDASDGNFMRGIYWQTRASLRKKFDLDSKEKKYILAKEAVAACILGVSRKAEHAFMSELYELAHDIRNFEDDGTCPDGYGCARHDQTLLGILAYQKNLVVHRQDPRQEKPMLLHVGKICYPFYITWRGPYVNEKTCIYSSRWDFVNYDHYMSCIKYKTLETAA